MKIKIVGIVFFIYILPGIFFSLDYGYFNKQTWQKINGEPYRRSIVEAYYASHSDAEIYICAEVELRGKRKKLGILLPVDMEGEKRYTVVDNINRIVTVPEESVDGSCSKGFGKKLPIETITLSESDRSYADLRYKEIKEKKFPSIYAFKGDYSSLIVNMSDLDNRFDDYFVELSMKNMNGGFYWYLILPFAFIADCLTYPFQYFIYTHLGIA